MTPDTTIAPRLAEIRQLIAAVAKRSGRQTTDITLVAVTKTHPVETIAEAANLGVVDVGENRVQEALEKIKQLRQLPLRWHLIGHLQSNKAKHAIQNFEMIHSLDSTELATALDKHAQQAAKQQQVLLQVNVSGEDSKFGLSPEAVVPTLEHILQHCPSLHVRGLMTMAPLVDDPELARPHFAALRILRDNLASQFAGTDGFSPEHLSMGMTNDFEVAIEEGATILRIGSAIFGSR